MIETLIRGGTVVHTAGSEPADVAIAGGRIAALLKPGEAATARKILDAQGCLLLPGLIDAHVHLRDPGLTHKEDFSTSTHAAALGGVTTVLDMPTDDPWTATAAQLAEKMVLAEGRVHVDIGFQAAVGRRPEDMSALLDLKPVSFEIFTADVPEEFLFPQMADVASVLRRFRSAATTVGVSPGDQSLLAAAGRGDGSIKAFLDSRPALAEASGVARALLAAADTGAPIHVRQINSAAGLEAWSKLRHIADASVETTPQNLFFTAADYGARGAAIKASPPFRSASDRNALRQALREGLIDVVATDHAPHSPAEKAMPYSAFADIPGGMAGLQTLLPLMLKLVDERVIGLPDIARMCAANPARRFGLGHAKGAIAAGLDADIVVLDPQGQTTISDAAQVSKAGSTPFAGWTFGGRIRRVLLRGREIVRDGVLVARAQGRVVTRGD